VPQCAVATPSYLTTASFPAFHLPGQSSGGVYNSVQVMYW
jgi:hypothetical protein